MSLHVLATKSDCLDFRRSYSMGAIRGAYWASIFGGVSYFSFLVVAWFSEDSTATSIAIRASLVLLLIFSAVFFSEVTEVAVSYYQEVAALVSGIVLLGTVYLVSTHGGGNPSSPTGASPSLVFGLFIHYAFLKLSIAPAAFIGCTVSLIYAVFGAPIWIGGNEEVRTGIYLLLVNSVGVMVCRTSEQRERELFCERSRVVDAELRSMNRAEIAERATLEKSRLLAAVGHDVRQPLVAAIGYLDMLKNSHIVREELGVAKYLNHATESVKLIGSTLDHVLALGRLDRGRSDLSISKVDLISLLERLSATLRLEAKNRGVDLRIEIPDGYLEVSSNLGALWQILLNLTSNAIKYSAASEMSGRRVLVRCKVRDGICRIRIADNGIGVSRLHREMIWQPYYQVAIKGGREKDGLGLGLFLVRNAADLLEKHTLSLRSRLGKGSVFSLTLPGVSRSTSSWVDEGNGMLFGRVALKDVFGSYVLVYQASQINLQDMLELFAEWGVVSEVREDFSSVEELAKDEDRDFDVVLLCHACQLLSELNSAIEKLRSILGRDTYVICLSDSNCLIDESADLPKRVRLLKSPWAAVDLAQELALGTEKNRNSERMDATQDRFEGF